MKECFDMLVYRFKKPPMFNIPKTTNSYQFLLNLDSEFALTLLIKDLEISYISANIEKNRFDRQIPLIECDIFTTAIKTTINFLIQKRREIKSNINDEEGVKDELYRLIKSLIPLYYKVEGNHLYIHTPNQELIDELIKKFRDKNVEVVYDKS